MSAAFSSDGARIVTAATDRMARIWDAATGKEMSVLRGHEDWVRSAGFSTDGRIVTASDDGTARRVAVTRAPNRRKPDDRRRFRQTRRLAVHTPWCAWSV